MTARYDTRTARLQGFTLVELLVVIGIIGVLISILLPALAKARQHALAAQCANNLRGLAQGWGAYADVHKGIVVPGRLPRIDSTDSAYGLGQGMQYRPRWYELLGAFGKKYATANPRKVQDDSWTIESSFFLCPAVPDWRNSRNYVFGYNHQFLGDTHRTNSGKWVNYPVRVSSIKAGQTVMAMDSMGTAAGKPAAQRTGYYNDGTKDPYALGNKGWAIDPPRLIPGDSDYADSERRNPQDRSGPDPRHMGKVNVVFCDGHVERMSLQDLGYIVRPDGAQEAVNQAANNKWFSGTGRNDNPPSIRR